jgi:uncharacterized protein
MPAEGPDLVRERPAWGPGRALAALAALLVAVAVEAGIVAAFDPEIESLAARLTLQALLAATLVAVAFVAARPGPGIAGPAALGFRRPRRPAVGVTVLAYLVYIGCALVLAALLQPDQEDITRELGYGESTLGSIAAGILIVAVAPLSEEVFFRGLLFRGIRGALPFAAAAAISAGIWGLFHYTGSDSWPVVLQLAVFGVILAWLYERTGSLWPPIVLHLFNNALAFAILTS